MRENNFRLEEGKTRVSSVSTQYVLSYLSHGVLLNITAFSLGDFLYRKADNMIYKIPTLCRDREDIGTAGRDVVPFFFIAGIVTL